MTDQITRTKDDDRLRGWKEIASVLHASERTVQRWEETMGLPVHRVPGARGDQVFAYRTEIDAWVAADHRREQRDPSDVESTEKPATTEPASAPSRPMWWRDSRRWGLVSALLAVGVLLAFGARWGGGELESGRRPSALARTSDARREPPSTARRQAAKPILLKITADGVASVIGVADGKLARISVPRHSLTLGVVPRALPGKVAVRLFRIEGTTVSGEPLLTEIASREIAAGSPSRYEVGPVTVLLEWLPAAPTGGPQGGMR